MFYKKSKKNKLQKSLKFVVRKSQWLKSSHKLKEKASIIYKMLTTLKTMKYYKAIE